MRVSKEYLENVIEEETNAYLAEVGLCHDAKGHFTKCEKGTVYSLTKKGAADNNIDPKFSKRGIVTKKEKGEPPSVSAKFGMNTSRKKSAGRKLIKGDDIYPKYSVSKYPEKYKEELSQETGLPIKSRYKPSWPSSKERKRQDAMGKPDRVRGSWIHGGKELSDLAKMKGLYETVTLTGADVVELILEAFTGQTEAIEEGSEADACRRMGFVTVAEAQKRILKALNAFSLAQDGKLFSKEKG